MADELRFDGEVAVITGAGGGLGRAHAKLLADRGATVVINDVDADSAADTATWIGRSGGKAVAVAGGVDSPASASAMIEATVAEYGRLDVLINNAGIAGAAWDDGIRVNLSGSFWTIHAAWPHLVGQGYGRIVNTTSSAGLFGFAAPDGQPLDFYAYGAAKMGVVGLTAGLAFAGEPHGVAVNAVAPVAHTRMSAANPDPRTVHWLHRYFPARLVAPVVAYLAHRDCPVTGQVITTGGGRLARVFVGETRGYTDPRLTPESVRAHFAEACDLAGHTVPVGTAGEMSLFDPAVRPRRRGEVGSHA